MAYCFDFYIDKDEFYSFIDAYKNSKNHYLFQYGTENNYKNELYRFTKSNLQIDCQRVNDVVMISYINKTALEKITEEQEAEENDETYYSDF